LRSIFAGRTSRFSSPTTAQQIRKFMDDSLNQLWQRVLAEVENRRPLFRAWLEPAAPLSLDDEILKLGFPAEYSLAMKTLLKPAYRNFWKRCSLGFSAARGWSVMNWEPPPFSALVKSGHVLLQLCCSQAFLSNLPRREHFWPRYTRNPE
jgi:hypothetical protein